ncbi:hypothetical protein Btru_068556 [Bulinus truncatus]|nr:hypothetical protein Btru_068556 [Bulinus truncatus]
MESKSCARTRSVLHKRKCEQSILSASVHKTPKKRSSLSRLSQSITSSLKVTKRNRSIREKPQSSTCVLSQSFDANTFELNKSYIYTDPRTHNSLLSDKSSLYLNGTFSAATAIAGAECFRSWQEVDCSYARDDSKLSAADSNACIERPPKYRRLATNTSVDHRPDPEGASCARCYSGRYWKKTCPEKIDSQLGQNFSTIHSASLRKRYFDTSYSLYTAPKTALGADATFCLEQQAANYRQHIYKHQQLNSTYTHGLSLAVGEESGSNSHKLITACSVNNISKQTAELGQNDSSGRVASWAVNFEKLLRDPIGLGIFTEFLKKEFSEENIIFWKACEQYRQLADDQQRKVKAKDIYTRYLSTKASEPVNVDSSARLYSEKFLDNPTAIMFDVAQQQIFQLMRQDSYARFLKSDLYKKKLMEDMEGRPLETPVEDNKLTESKKKVKGKENDDKRRRSILPWKHGKKSSKMTTDSDQKRNGKKDTNNTNLNSSSAGTSTATTVTHSNGLATLKKAPGPGIDLSTMRKEVFNAKEHPSSSETHFKFCRIVMPDGSTTVVCAKPGQTSRSVLSKLCEKRSLSIASVDVFLLGSDKPLDLNEDISTLGSKEIVIERRVLFRLDLPNGKSIGVKAKPNRSIRDVFKPILTKYGYNIDSIGVHLVGLHELLDLNMSVSDLDNQRAVIIQDVDIAEILRQGAEPVALYQTKVPSVSRSKVGQYGARGGSLEEITNKIFEDLMRGKSQLAHGFDELGVLELDRYKVHKNVEGRSLGLFGLQRKESAAVKDTHKGNKLKGKVTFTLPKNDTKKKSTTKEGERLFDMLSSAQKLRLEEQRGVHISTGDLPTFLFEESKKQENIDHLKDAQITKSHLSGVNMFDDVDEISKVGFLEKTKKKELVDFPGTGSPVVFNNNISQETSKTNHFQIAPSSEKWKSLSVKNKHENCVNMKNVFVKKDSAVMSSPQTETYFQMSPVIIDAKRNLSSLDDNEKFNILGKTPTRVLAPEVLAKNDPEFNSMLFKRNSEPFDPTHVSQTKTQVSPDFNSASSVNNFNEMCRSPHADSYLGTKTANSLEIMQQPDKVLSLDNNVLLSMSPSAENQLVSQKHPCPRLNQLKQVASETLPSTESFSSDIQLLTSSRHDKHPVYRPVDPPPYKKRSTPLLVSSPRIHGVGSLTSNSQNTSPQNKRLPTSNSYITTPQNKPLKSVLNGNFKSKSELQFVQWVNSPQSVHPNTLQFSLSSNDDTDQEDETVTFV